MEYEKPKKKFIILEHIPLNKNHNKFYHVINLENKTEISIGRDHENDVIIKEKTASRTHVILKIINGKIFL